jgi:predicted DNA-binding protein (MmcQ/YjbR family)
MTRAPKNAVPPPEALRELAAAKPGAVEDHPWDETELVYKVGGKIFVFFGLHGPGPAAMMVSCGPDAAEWRDRYPAEITIGPYIGRYGWNSVLIDGGVPMDELRELLDLSYERVVNALPKSKRPALD